MGALVPEKVVEHLPAEALKKTHFPFLAVLHLFFPPRFLLNPMLLRAII